MFSKLRFYGGAVIRMQMRRLVAAFLAKTADPRAVQQAVLRDLLALNAGTDFAKRHALHEVRTVADLRQRVPVSDYTYFRPYIERVKQGETSALLGSSNRLLMFALTSGTTADSKFLPITKRFLDDYRRGWSIWSIRAYDDHPTLFLQKIVQLSSDHDQFRTIGGHPCGNISGLATAMQNRLVRTMYSIPAIVSKIRSPEAKYYTAMRFSLANRIAGLLLTANPSTLIQLAKLGDDRKQELIRDIFNGTLSSRVDVSPEVRESLRRQVRRRDRRRAQDLEAIVEKSGHLYPRNYWSGLSLMGVWTGGSAGAYTRGLRTYYGNVPIRDHGLSASEGRMTIPLWDDRPDGILDIASHFFEFIPEEEYGRPNLTALEAHELEEGRNYYILLTTSAGLWRYDIKDVVKCVGWYQSTPLLEFLNKGAHISSITGEKVSESQVVAAVRDAVAAMNVPLSCYTVAPVWGDPPGYRLLAEVGDLPSAEAGEQLAAHVDTGLQALNMEYGEKRRTGRLAPLAYASISPGSWNRFARERQSGLGGSVEQYKHPCLVPDLAFYEAFLSRFSPSETQPESA